ncbi:hypothetical protein GCM10011322_41710 [Salinarimonas ramus]|uniref:Uncharacterized protein n=2 Tax=Salinarimonas ramus TaxID=690164 RepID=A0A917V838_9HYPH|nr:hypothetical protein GCM10011322_41710 [Salinarimonas ramus]
MAAAQTRAPLAGSLAADDGAARAVLALVPLAVATIAALAAGLAGVHSRGLIGTPFEPFAFGFFVERFPLAAFLVVYAVVRVALLALIPPGPSRFLRLALLPIALALVLVPALYPTFGGLVIRAAYFTGGMAFLQGTPLAIAYPVGAFVSAFVFAAGLGAAAIVARARMTFGVRAALGGAARLLALWFAAMVVAAPTALGLPIVGDWPVWPLTAPESLAAAALVALALAPHALIVWRSGR